MGVTANEQIARAVRFLQDGLTDAEPIPMRYCKGTPRVFLVLPQPEHLDIIAQRVERPASRFVGNESLVRAGRQVKYVALQAQHTGHIAAGSYS